MARPLRIEYSGAMYHVTSRGNARKFIFKNDKDRRTFLFLLESVIERNHWLCHAYCLMNNHYHLVVETPDGNLSKGMRQLNGVYTMRFNNQHHSVGHIFQGRYKAILIQKESYLLEVCRYVMLNPVRSKLVETPDRWQWSSFRGTVGMEKPHPCLTVDWILGQFGKKRRRAERGLKRFVQEGICQKSIWQGVKGQSILGNNEFLTQMIPYLKGHEEIREIPKSQRYLDRPSLEILFRHKSGDKVQRNKIIVNSVERWGYTQKEIADYLGLHYSTVSRLMKDNAPQTSRFKT